MGPGLLHHRGSNSTPSNDSPFSPTDPVAPKYKQLRELLGTSEIRRWCVERRAWPLYVGLQDLRTVFFGGIADLDTVYESTFQKCKDGKTPPFHEG